MATTWSCSDGHTHDMRSGNKDSNSVGGIGRECGSSGDRITGMNYTSDGGTPTREWTASTRVEAAAT